MPKDVSIKASKKAPSALAASKTKTTSNKAAAPPPPAATKAKAAVDLSDIDSIFASGPSRAPPAPEPIPEPSAKSKKKKAKKDKAAAAASGASTTTPETTETPAAVSTVQMVIDPSIGVGKKVDPPPGLGKNGRGIPDDIAAFRDSRGTGVSTGRKTEDGLTIFKEAHLDIDPEAGGTELCPFDCDCCY